MEKGLKRKAEFHERQVVDRVGVRAMGMGALGGASNTTPYFRYLTTGRTATMAIVGHPFAVPANFLQAMIS